MGILSFRRLSRVWAAPLALGLFLFSSVLHAETFKLGLHYDLAKDGHGFDLHKIGNTYVLFLYTYDESGNPEWYLGVGDWDDGVISGSLDRYTYIAANNPPQTADPDIAGNFILDYRFAAVQGACNDGVNRGYESQKAAFAFKIRDENYVWCTQFLFGAQANTTPYYGGAWHTPSDPGYGFSMSQQDDIGIAIVYYYDSNNDPRWALAIGPPDGEMTLENYTGYCRSCPLVERIIEPAGSITLNWDASTAPGSGADTADLALSYPTAPFGDWNRQMTPTLITDGQPTAEVSIGEMPGQDFFNMFISRQLIESRCIACHVDGGVSSGTRLVYTAGDQTGNFSQLAALANTEGGDYILNKARGVSHGGSAQLPSDSNEYLDLELLFGDGFELNFSINEYYGTTIPAFVAEPPEDYELFDSTVTVYGQLEGLGHQPTAEPGAGKFVFNRVYRAFKHGLENGQQFGVFGSWLSSFGNNSIEGGLWVNPKTAGAHYYPTLHLAGIGDTYHACNDVQMGSGLYERFLGDKWLTMVQISNKVLTVPGVNIAFDKNQEPYEADNGIWLGSGWTYLNLDHPRNFKYWMSFIETYSYQLKFRSSKRWVLTFFDTSLMLQSHREYIELQAANKKRMNPIINRRHNCIDRTTECTF